MSAPPAVTQACGVPCDGRDLHVRRRLVSQPLRPLEHHGRQLAVYQQLSCVANALPMSTINSS